MKTLIKVNQECLERGGCGESESCPIALAFHEVGIQDVSVYEEHIFVNGIQYVMPEPARRFIKAWDDPVKEDPEIPDWNVGMFKPFEFEIELPDDTRITPLRQ